MNWKRPSVPAAWTREFVDMPHGRCTSHDASDIWPRSDELHPRPRTSGRGKATKISRAGSCPSAAGEGGRGEITEQSRAPALAVAAVVGATRRPPTATATYPRPHRLRPAARTTEIPRGQSQRAPRHPPFPPPHPAPPRPRSPTAISPSPPTCPGFPPPEPPPSPSPSLRLLGRSSSPPQGQPIHSPASHTPLLARLLPPPCFDLSEGGKGNKRQQPTTPTILHCIF
jgi:hypothetical protein